MLGRLKGVFAKSAASSERSEESLPTRKKAKKSARKEIAVRPQALVSAERRGAFAGIPTGVKSADA
jgi:hypothetical protein